MSLPQQKPYSLAIATVCSVPQWWCRISGASLHQMDHCVACRRLRILRVGHLPPSEDFDYGTWPGDFRYGQFPMQSKIWNMTDILAGREALQQTANNRERGCSLRWEYVKRNWRICNRIKKSKYLSGGLISFGEIQMNHHLLLLISFYLNCLMPHIQFFHKLQFSAWFTVVCTVNLCFKWGTSYKNKNKNNNS